MLQTLRRLAIVLAVAGAYYTAGRLGLSLATVNASTTAVWPPAGIAVATFMLFGVSVWPGILLGAFLVNLSTSGNVAVSSVIAIGNTVMGWIGSALVARFAGGHQVFQRPATIFEFAGLAALSTTVSASIGTTSLVLGGLASEADFGRIWLTWWLGDTAGVLVFTPFLYLWSMRVRPDWKPRELLEAGLMLATLVAVSLFVFAGVSPMQRKDYPLEFLCFPVLAWVMFRFTQRAASTTTVVLAAVAIWGTLRGHGPFHRDTIHESLLMLQAFLGVISILVLAVSAIVAERKRNDLAMRRLNEELEDRVARRTQQLRAANDELSVQIQDRTRAREVLAEIEARLQEAQKVARVGSWEWDIARNVVWWSDELYALYGLDPAMFGASYEAFLERVHPEDRVAVHRHIEMALEQAGTFSFEHRIVQPDGTTLTLLAHGHTITDGAGKPIRMTGTGQDITDRKQAEEQRVSLAREQSARLEAEEANRMKDEFLATLSHELRTPLNAIVGWAEVLRAGQLDAAGAARAIETIGRNAHIQSQLISDILDSSRMSLGRFDLKKQRVDLVTVIESGLETMKPAAESKRVRLESRASCSTAPVSGDPDRLQQVIWNLLTNAIKFAPEGGCVKVSITDTGQTAELRVEDDGPGIDATLLPHIFDRFRQGDSSSTRRHGGLGLGLAIVKHIVDLHGGRVAAGNRQGATGAFFTVTLPLAGGIAEIPDGFPQLVAAPSGADGFSLRGLRVLVVEDDDDSREVIGVLMSTSGADVLAASSAAEALDLLRASRPHLMISDIEMPEENGYELMARIRALPAEQGGTIPAIALTAYAGAENANRAIRSGYQAHLAKPVQIDKLLYMVATVMRESPGQQ